MQPRESFDLSVLAKMAGRTRLLALGSLAVCSASLSNASLPSIGQRDLAIQPYQPHLATTGLQIMLRCEHGFTGFLDQRIPLAAIAALPFPAMRDRAAILTDIFFLWFGHTDYLSEQIKNASAFAAK